MNTFRTRLDSFFFTPRSAMSFGLLRIVWAATVLARMLMLAPEMARYFSASGMLPPALEAANLRGEWRFSLLDVFSSPAGVTCVYIALLTSAVLMLIGAFPRWSTIASVLLLFSFHERNPFPFSGGDTVLRLLGFLLMIAPGIEAFSYARYRTQWAHWKTHKRLLPAVQMPMWPWRLLLWQMTVMYVVSVWSKLLGESWRWGTAMSIMLQHPQYSRAVGPVADVLSTHSVLLTYSAIAFEGAWLLMLIPPQRGWLRRFLIGYGMAFHFVIDRLMRVGPFLPAMSAGLIGLLQGEDFERMRKWLNRKRRGKIAVLYDGHCGFCSRSVFTLLMLDNLHRLQLIDYHDARARAAVAPDLKFADLDKAMHIRMADGRTFKAFRAFRALTWNLPALWVLAPFLYIPGIAWIGEKVYIRISQKRVRCSHDGCQI